MTSLTLTTTPSAADLNNAAIRALTARDYAAAAQMLQQALQQEPENMNVWLNLAVALKANGDFADALKVLDKTLELNPRMFNALLMKGTILEGHGMLREAAIVYGQAVNLAPPADRLDAPTQQALHRARELNRRFALDIFAEVDEAISKVATGKELARARQFANTLLGLKPLFRQEPTHYRYPELPAIEFYDSAEIPGLAELEVKTPIIQHELMQVLGSTEGFAPYIDYPADRPLDQWSQLNRSTRWSAFHFYYQGVRHHENCVRCPQTIAAVQALGQPSVGNQMPNAMFSVLEPHTRIPPHTGVANVRLVVHLPLLVPPNCGFRVGNSIREWELGKALVFDDTIQHEAWNDSDQTRVVMIFDVWSPRIPPGERDLIKRVMEAVDAQIPLTTSPTL